MGWASSSQMPVSLGPAGCCDDWLIPQLRSRCRRSPHWPISYLAEGHSTKDFGAASCLVARYSINKSASDHSASGVLSRLVWRGQVVPRSQVGSFVRHGSIREASVDVDQFVAEEACRLQGVVHPARPLQTNAQIAGVVVEDTFSAGLGSALVQP